MKLSRRWMAALAILGGVTWVSRAELAQWIQHVPAGSPYEAFFFRTVNLPSGTVASRKPPRETISDLSAAITANARQAELYRLRALENEEALDFTAAEADWRRYNEAAADKQTAAIELADFHHRRLQPTQELQALATARMLPAAAADRLKAGAEQTSWRLFERSLALADAQALPREAHEAIYRQWLTRYPQEPSVYTRFSQALLTWQQYPAAEALAAQYQKQFPNDEAFPVHTRAEAARRRGSVADAVRIYDQSYRPLWPPALVQNYFKLLQETRGLRTFLADARTAAAQNPTDINAATRIFYYWQQQGSIPQALRTLAEFRLRKQESRTPWAPAELHTIASLFEELRNYDEAVKSYHDLYNLPGAQPADVERGLAGVIRILFTAPEEQIRLGMGDLTFYKDIATMDPYPGALNGILSLVFNASDPSGRFENQERQSVSYFHRAKAAELLAIYDRRFPNGSERASLHASLVGAYANHVEDDAVIRSGRQFLASFPNHGQRVTVALLIADAHARRNQTKEEFAVYDGLLKELAAAADNVPIGVAQPLPPFEEEMRDEEQRQASPGFRSFRENRPAPSRSPLYVQVLDRYIARLVAMKQVKEALALYRGEIDRNPNDPGLYDRLAQFLEQNRLAADTEQLYTRAIKQFDDRTWHHRLARWYLRRKQNAQFEKLTREAAAIFSGTELEKYFAEIVAGANLDATLYRQVNLYAHQRFPHDLVFVKNLLSAYRRQGTVDAAAWERLIRQHWYYDNELRARFFEFLSSTNRLDAEVAALSRMNAIALADRVVVQTMAEAQAWQSHFENAAPVMRTLAMNYPGNAEINTRAAAVHRSLGDIANAVTMSDRMHRKQPRDMTAAALPGDILADREQFTRARQYWDRIPAIEPGKPEGYLEAATIYHDYFLFDDALRQIAAARAKLSDPALFAYEAGAIYENKRDYSTAIAEYAKGAAATAEPTRERRRLLLLARRPAHRESIDALTGKLASGADPAPGAFTLRVALLENQDRRQELGAFLAATGNASANFDQLSRVDEVARRLGFDDIREQSMSRQIALTNDPVERTRLRIALARFQEGRNNAAAAQRTIDAVYKENPRILGVVRAAVDFHWRTKNAARSVAVLEEAAASSNAEYRRAFILEGARKATESGDYAHARRLLTPVFTTEPLAADLVAAMADTYARAGDDAGLRQFYTARITEATTVPVRAGLRRSLIPVLTRVKDHAGAVDQYIEIINRFPDDQALLLEAAAYARANNLSARLSGYYEKASASSPRDARLAMVLARVHAAFEDYPAAIATYSKAISIRPERTDLLIARAGLEERLMRFDEAAQSYTTLYERAWHNPQWMVKLAETRARQGQADAAVAALRKAFLEGKSPRPADYFEIARRLDSWGMQAQAKTFADQGFQAVSRNTSNSDDLAFYVGLYARLRQYDQGLANAMRVAEPESGLRLLNEIAQVARQYYTPEEKAAFATWLQKTQTGRPVDAAIQAGVLDIAVDWLQRALTAARGEAPRRGELQQLVDLQKRRMRHADLAAYLEGLWKIQPPDAEGRDQLLERAADAYRGAGNGAQELRVLGVLEENGALSETAAARLQEVLRTAGPERLVTMAGQKFSNTTRANAVTTAISIGNPGVALRAVTARGIGLPPVWTQAYTALTGYYFRRTQPDITQAFQTALGSQRIADQLGRQVDRDQQLAGDNWFYYGARYGEYLALTKQPNSDDYVSAELEGNPASPNAYLRLADYFREVGQPQRALAEYDHALLFNPDLPQAHTRVAEILRAQGRSDQANARWRQALEGWSTLQDRRSAPEHFWSGVEETLTSIGNNKVFPALRPQADRLLRTYVRRNGTYRVEGLLRAGLAAAGGGPEGVAWLADMARAASDHVAFLGWLAAEEWIPPQHRGALYERLIDAASAEVSRTFGEDRERARSTLFNWQIRYIDVLINSRDTARARTLFELIAIEDRQERQSESAPVEIRLAAAAGTLDQLLARYTREPGSSPSLTDLRHTGNRMTSEGQRDAARHLLRYVYTAELDRQNIEPSNFLGLAEVLLESGDVPGAVALLRRMSLVAGEPFENLEPAAALLDRFNRRAEAMEFRRERVRAAPWDRQASAGLAVAESDAAKLRLLAAGREAPYAARAEAADALGRIAPGVATLGSAELDLLARGGALDPAASERRYFARSRVRAAETASIPDIKIRLLAGSLGMDPDNNQARIALFQAAIAGSRWQTALTALTPMLEQSGFGYWIRDASPNAGGPASSMAQQFLSNLPLTSAERARYARDIARASRSLDDHAVALRLLRVAQHLEPLPGTETEITAIAGDLQAREANALRAPVINPGLEQDRPVRPRLLAQGGSR